MNPILVFLIVLGGCSLGLGLFIAAVTWAARRWDQADNAASGFPTVIPYIEPVAPYTRTTETADDFLRGDFDPRASLDRLRAEVDAARTEAVDPTSPARLRPIPGQRKGDHQ